MKSETLYRIWGYALIFLVTFAIASLLVNTAHCQTVLMPMPRQCFPDNLSSGKPLAGGKIFTYQAGTSTPQATYTDATGLIANSNPVILDAAGCWSIWLTSGQAYRFVAQNSAGVQEWATDQVSGLATVGSAFNQAITTVTFSATPTFTATGQYQVFKMTLTGNVTSSTLSMTGVTAPSIVSFELTQDGTGGRTFVWPLNVTGGLPLNPTANAVSTQTYFWDGTTAWPVNYPLQQSTTVPFSATPTFTATSQFQLFKMTLTGNVTSSSLVMTGINAPAYVTFEITQDGTGGRTFVWPGNVFNPPAVMPGPSVSTISTFFWDGSALIPANAPPTITSRITGADFTTSSTTAVNVLTIGAMAANQTYSFDAWLACSSTGSGVAVAFGTTGPAAPTNVFVVVEGGPGNASNIGSASVQSSYVTSSPGSLPASSTFYVIRVFGTIENGVNSGNLILQANAVGATTLTCKRGSFATIRVQ